MWAVLGAKLTVVTVMRSAVYFLPPPPGIYDRQKLLWSPQGLAWERVWIYLPSSLLSQPPSPLMFWIVWRWTASCLLQWMLTASWCPIRFVIGKRGVDGLTVLTTRLYLLYFWSIGDKKGRFRICSIWSLGNKCQIVYYLEYAAFMYIEAPKIPFSHIVPHSCASLAFLVGCRKAWAEQKGSVVKYVLRTQLGVKQ